jgi:hypothetical protein
MFVYLSREEMLAVIGKPDGTWLRKSVATERTSPFFWLI